MQRELSVGNVDDVKKSLLVNAFGRFPLVLSYCFMGIFIGAVFASPEGLAKVADVFGMNTAGITAILREDPDRMVPMFILTFLPHGIIGFIFVAIMAALMSSLDSGLNSLSAVTMKDFYQKYVKRNANERHYLLASKVITLIWGIFCVVTALIFYSFGESTRQTTIVLINAVGSMLYGPILAAFLVGIFSKKVGPAAIKMGIVLGIVSNLLLWIFTSISWLWWNVTGFFSTVFFAYLGSHTIPNEKDFTLMGDFGDSIEKPSGINWKRIYTLVGLYFLVIVLISWLVENIA